MECATFGLPDAAPTFAKKPGRRLWISPCASSLRMAARGPRCLVCEAATATPEPQGGDTPGVTRLIDPAPASRRAPLTPTAYVKMLSTNF